MCSQKVFLEIKRVDMCLNGERSQSPGRRRNFSFWEQNETVSGGNVEQNQFPEHAG